MRLSNAADKLLDKMAMRLTLLDDGGRSKNVVIMSRDVMRFIEAGYCFSLAMDERRRILKLFGCDVKIVEGKGILCVGYDLSDSVPFDELEGGGMT